MTHARIHRTWLITTIVDTCIYTLCIPTTVSTPRTNPLSLMQPHATIPETIIRFSNTQPFHHGFQAPKVHSNVLRPPLPHHTLQSRPLRRRSRSLPRPRLLHRMLLVNSGHRAIPSRRRCESPYRKCGESGRGRGDEG